MPVVSFKRGKVMWGGGTQSKEDKEFAGGEIEVILEEILVEKVDERQVTKLLRDGNMVSPLFEVLKGEGGEKKEKFAMNFNGQIKHW